MLSLHAIENTRPRSIALAMKIICDIYKSPKASDTYLYVRKEDGLSKVPEALLNRFGAPNHVMTLLLESGKKLARVQSERVMHSISAEGYFLQLPPAKETEMAEIHAKNTKIGL